MSPLAATCQHLLLLILLLSSTVTASATWCVARSDAGELQLKTALDYACGSGADCTPIQAQGLCFLPNTMQAHASYAYNSYYQRKGNAPGTCDFSGTATVAKTDPSYGSCVYPASPSQAGGIGTGSSSSSGTSTGTNIGTNIPTLSVPPPPGNTVPLYGGLTPGFTPGMGTTTEPITSNSRRTRELFRIVIVVVYIFSVWFI